MTFLDFVSQSPVNAAAFFLMAAGVVLLGNAGYLVTARPGGPARP